MSAAMQGCLEILGVILVILAVVWVWVGFSAQGRGGSL